jgi:PAS domain S-box-containing protein
MSANQITLDVAIYNELQATLANLQQRVTELEHADRDRRQAETALHQSEELFRTTFEQAAIGISFSTLSGRFTHFNQQWCEIVGYEEEELWELTTQDITHPDDAVIELELTEKLLAGEISDYSLEKRYIRPDRSIVWVNLTASLIYSPLDEPRYLISMMQNISDRKQAEIERQQAEQQLQQKARDLETALTELQQTQTHLVQSEKMSSLGQLVAGVAHEINNPVNFIYGNLNYANDYIHDLLNLLQLYQEYCPTPPPAVQDVIDTIDLDFLIEDLPKLLVSMRVGAERIREIIASLRNFSRLDEAEFKTVDLHEGIDSTLMILQNRFKAQSSRPEIQLFKEYAELPKIQCYPGQLNQVFMNILTNAIDALEESMRLSDAHAATANGHAPSIWIRTRKVGTDHISISIQDNGMGIPPHTRDRLFDPFFTTKPVGKGTGLGMSISYQIITEKHHGSLRCESELGQGAEFIITIPIQQTAPSAL